MSKSIQHFQCEHNSTELILVTVSTFLKTSLKVIVDCTPHGTSIQQDVNFGTETLNLPGKCLLGSEIECIVGLIDFCIIILLLQSKVLPPASQFRYRSLV